MNSQYGKVMISYAWDLNDPSHHSWVEKLYSSLSASGLSVTLDKYSLPMVGTNNTFLWMERAVKEAEWIVAVITEKYIEKCDDRDNGNSLGYEIEQIIAKFIKTGRSDRVICITRHHNRSKGRTPSFLPNAFGFDLSDDSLWEDNFNAILTLIQLSLKDPKKVQNHSTNTQVYSSSQKPRTLVNLEKSQWKMGSDKSIFHCLNEPAFKIKLTWQPAWYITDAWAVASLGKGATKVRVALEIDDSEHLVYDFAVDIQRSRFLPLPQISENRLKISYMADKLAIIINTRGGYEMLKASANMEVL